MSLKVPQHLKDAAKKRKLIPFIGAGLSKGLGLPDWSEVTNIISSELGMDPEICATYGDYLQIAEYYVLQYGTISPLRSKLDKLFNSDSIDVTTSPVHMLLPMLDTKTVYTTNWDEFLEKAYLAKNVPHKKITSLQDIRNTVNSETQVIKFHGDFSGNDKDIVLTEASYFSRLDFESPLDIKLRADVISNTLLFMGYSFSDINIRYLWFKLSKILDSIPLSHRRPVGYIVTTQNNPVFSEISTHNRGIDVIHLDPLSPTDSLIELLEELIANL